MVYINLCVCVYVCVSILWGVIYYFYIVLSVFVYNYLHTHKKNLCSILYLEKEIEKGEKRKKNVKKSSVVLVH